MFRSIMLVTGSMLLVVALANAAAPNLVNYQGRLTNVGGTPVPDGTYSVAFTIYDAASGGTSKWTETQSVTTSGGLFDILLGSVNPISDTVFIATGRYLGIKIGADPEISPRSRLVTVPYAYRVNTVDSATGGTITGNINLDSSTATKGNILKHGSMFLHNYGLNNTFVGLNAGNLSMTGTDNTGVGLLALEFISTGFNNTAIGSHALTICKTGIENTAAGFQALEINTSGNNNTATGVNALGFDTSGSQNTADGDLALHNNITGNFNTAVGGYQTLAFNTSGNNNTACGSYALKDNITGSNNTAIGYLANVSTDGLSNATAIGYTAIVDASNKIRLGDSAVTVIEAQVGLTVVSDSTQKENFARVNGDDVLDKIGGLHVRTWNYKGHDPKQFRHYGPVAQEFFAAFGHDGTGTIGSPTTINSQDLEGVMLIAIQALETRTAEVESVKAENKNLRKELDELKNVVGQIVARSTEEGHSQLSLK